jgi:hypothetical protein
MNRYTEQALCYTVFVIPCCKGDLESVQGGANCVL